MNNVLLDLISGRSTPPDHCSRLSAAERDGGALFNDFMGIRGPRRTRLQQAEHLRQTADNVLATAEARGEPWVPVLGPPLERMAARELEGARRQQLLVRQERRRRALSEADQSGLREYIDLDALAAPPLREDAAGEASSIKAYQRRMGLTSDGWIGEITATALLGDLRRALDLQDHPRPTTEGPTR